MVVNCIAYKRDGSRIGEISLDAISDVLAQPDTFVWVGLHEPDEPLLLKLQEEFGLHDLAIEDAHNAHQRTKLEAYDDSLFLVVQTAQLIDSQLAFGETHIFLGQRYLVSLWITDFGTNAGSGTIRVSDGGQTNLSATFSSAGRTLWIFGGNLWTWGGSPWGQNEVTFTGGVSLNIGMVRTLEEILGQPINVSAEDHYINALNAALFALERAQAGARGEHVTEGAGRT